MSSKNPYFLQGLDKCKTQSYEEAIVLFTKAIEAEENPYIYSERGVAYLHVNNRKQALSDLDKALELEPNNPYRYSSRAYVRDFMGDVKGAVEDYKKAIELDPDDAIAYNNLGLLEEKLGYAESAKKRIKQADKLAAAQAYRENERKAFETAPPKEVTPTESSVGIFGMVKKTFASKATFKEFVSFIKNGFKLK